MPAFANTSTLAVILHMQPLEVYNRITSVFKEIEKHDNLDGLMTFVKSSELFHQVEAFYDKYPSFDFRLSPDDINNLRISGIINGSNKLEPSKFPPDPLSKLLGALLWKNGDINKVQHIIDGILGLSQDRSEYSLIFKQYGTSLSSDEEPIVDQHVLRAFEIFILEPYSEAAVEKSRKKSLFKTVDRPLLDKYRSWFQHLLSKVPNSERGRYSDTVDKIIFIHGKAVKY
jgi:hypothetical protein